MNIQRLSVHNLSKAGRRQYNQTSVKESGCKKLLLIAGSHINVRRSF